MNKNKIVNIIKELDDELQNSIHDELILDVLKYIPPLIEKIEGLIVRVNRLETELHETRPEAL